MAVIWWQWAGDLWMVLVDVEYLRLRCRFFTWFFTWFNKHTLEAWAAIHTQRHVRHVWDEEPLLSPCLRRRDSGLLRREDRLHFGRAEERVGQQRLAGRATTYDLRVVWVCRLPKRSLEGSLTIRRWRETVPSWSHMSGWCLVPKWVYNGHP